MLRNPGMDFGDWAKPPEASETALWMAVQPPSWTGNVITVAEVREAMGQKASGAGAIDFGRLRPQ